MNKEELRIIIREIISGGKFNLPEPPLEEIEEEKLDEYGITFKNKRYVSTNDVKKGKIYYKLPEKQFEKLLKLKAINNAKENEVAWFENINDKLSLEPIKISVKNVYKKLNVR